MNDTTADPAKPNVADGPHAALMWAQRLLLKTAYERFSDDATLDPQVFYKTLAGAVKHALDTYQQMRADSNPLVRVSSAGMLQLPSDLTRAYAKARSECAADAAFTSVRSSFLAHLHAEFEDTLRTASEVWKDVR